MFIAHVYFTVSRADRPQALQTLLDEAQTVRALPGCATFMPYLDPSRPDGLGIIHEWESEGDFARYLASPDFAVVGAMLRPMMTAAPISRRFHANLLDTVN